MKRIHSHILLLEGLNSVLRDQKIMWTPAEIEVVLCYQTKTGIVPFFQSLILAPLQTDRGRFLTGLAAAFAPAQKTDWKEWTQVLLARHSWLSSIHHVVKRRNLSPIDIWITVPYPYMGQSHFGKLQDRVLNFVEQADRLQAIRWWLRYLISQFTRNRLSALKLRGFVWGREAISQMDLELVKQFTKTVASYGLQSIWLPNYKSAFLAETQAINFSHVALYPNYTGHSPDESEWLRKTYQYALHSKFGIQIVSGKGPRFDPQHAELYLRHKQNYMKKGGVGPYVYRFPNTSLSELRNENPALYNQIYRSITH